LRAPIDHQYIFIYFFSKKFCELVTAAIMAAFPSELIIIFQKAAIIIDLYINMTI